MIDTLVFDMGNVLIEWNAAKVLAYLEPDLDRRERLNQAIFDSQIWVSVDRGDLTVAEAILAAKDRLDSSYDQQVEDVFTVWYQALSKKDLMQAVASSLKELGYRIFILSNTSEAFYSLEKAGFLPITASIDGKILSFEEKLIKPDPAIYQLLLDKFSLNADNCVFLDDIKENLLPAQAMGFKVIEVADESEAVVQLLELLKVSGKYGAVSIAD